jgi:magnesium transporter
VVDVRFVDAGGVHSHALDEVAELRTRPDGILWIDIPEWNDDAEKLLTTEFYTHPLALRDSRQRNQVPKVHVYEDHVFVVLHAPERGAAGHVHYVELDQFVGDRFLITVHGPVNPAVAPERAMVEVTSVLHRLELHKLQPKTSFELSYALGSALTGRMREFLAMLTSEVWSLEQRVTGDHLSDPEKFLDEMFRARHGLLAVRTMTALSREVYARMAKIHAFGPKRGQRVLEDTMDQFDRLHVMADSQKDYLQGTIEFYQARTNTKMTIAAERLAVIAAVTLPVTALSSILGMNVIVNESTVPHLLAIALVVMAIMSTTLLIWAKRRGWW